MTTIATSILGSIAKDIVKSIGVNFLEDLTGNFFGLTEKKHDDNRQATELLKEHSKELQEILTKINGINQQIGGLRSEIHASFFDLKITMVASVVNRIESHYDMYMSALRGLGHPDPNKKPELARKHVVALGEKTVNEIYTALSEIHTYLVNKVDTESLLQMADQGVIKKVSAHKDPLSYYFLMKSFLLNYTAVQMKGIFLLTCAWKDTEVAFSGAKEIIDRMYDNMDKQDEELASLMGHGQTSVMAEIFRSDDHGALCSWTSMQTQEYVALGVGPVEHEAPLISSKNFSIWSLELVLEDGEKLESLNISVHHKFKIRDPDQKYTLAGEGANDPRPIRRVDYKDPMKYIPSRNLFGFEFDGGDQLQIKELEGNDLDRHMVWAPGTSSTQFGFVSKERLDSISKSQRLFKLNSLWRYGIGSNKFSTSDQDLRPGMTVFSDNRQYRLQFGTGSIESRMGEILLMGDDAVIWRMTSIRAASHPQYGRLKISGEGSLVAYALDTDKPAWSTETGRGTDLGAFMVVTDDGKVQVHTKDHKVLWSRGLRDNVGDDRDL